MKKITRIISAALSTSLLASVVTVAPFSVSAVERENDGDFSTVSVESIENKTDAMDKTIEECKSFDSVGANESFSNDSFRYTINDSGEATITKYIGSDFEIVVPSNIDDYKVICIGKDAFKGCTKISSVSIPESVTTIGSYAFENCDGLTTITIPKSVTNASYLFRYCDNLKTVTFADGMTTIPQYILEYASSVESIVIPDSVTSIGKEAFKGCTKISSVSIPESVTTIGSYAFENCDGLTTITIPKNVTNASYLFRYCDNLKTVTFADGTTTIPQYILENASSVESIDIPNTVTNIGKEAFKGCTKLSSVSIPEGVTTIGSYAFENCDGLTTITIPKSVTNALYLFRYCDNLKTVTFADGMTTIPQYILEYASSVESIVIPDSVTSIGNYAFSGCTNLQSIGIPNTVTNIGKEAFKGCTKLSSVSIPEGVTTIGSYAFENCDGLTTITIPKNVTNASYLFRYCDNLKTVTFADGMTTIPQYILEYASSVESIVIPDSVTSIGNYAFSGCTNLQSIGIPNSVNSIGNYAFQGCTKISSVSIPESVTTIGSYAFENCDGLTTITIPKNVTNASYLFRYCDNLKTVTFADGMTTIPQYILEYASSVESIDIPNTVTSIGKEAFKGCTQLSSVIIPESVTTIGSYAFEGCSNLSNCVFSNTISKINDHAFKNCTSLADVVLPSNLTSLGSYSFENCSAINSIVIPKSLTSTGNAFYGCNNLKTVTFEQGTEKIPNGIMQNCTGLETAIIPDSVTEIGANTFNGCTSLSTIALSDSITFIGNNAFSNCTKLQQIFLGNNIGSVGGAFTNNSNSAVIYVNYGSLTASTLFNAKIDYQFNGASDKKYNYLNYEKTVFAGEFEKEIAFSCDYSIKDNDFIEMSEKKLIFRLPDGVEIVNGTVKINGKSFNGCKMNNGFLSIPITNKEASVSFCVTVSANNSLRVYAGFTFTSSELKKQTEIIDAIDFDLPLYANYDNISTDGQVNIEGTAPVNQDVTVFANGQEIAVLTSNGIGEFSGTVALPLFSDGDVFSIKLLSTNRFGNELSQQGNVRIMQNRPSISSFTLEYNGTSYDLMSEGSQQINIIAYSDDNPQPMRFVIRMNNTSEVDSVDVVSVKSDGKEYMVANWDDNENAFVAEGYFCEDNKAYIPGKLQLYINKQRSDDVIDKNWVNSKIRQELPTSLQNAQLSTEIDTESSKKYTITLQDGSEVVYRYNRLNYDEAITQYTSDLGENINNKNSSESVGAIAEDSVSVNTKLIQLCTRYGWTLVSGYLDKQTGQQKDIYTTTIENDTEIITYFYDTTTDFIVKEAVSTAKSETKSFILNTLLGEENASTLGTMKSIYSLATTEMDYTVNYMSDVFSLKEMEYQIMQDNSLSPSQKEQKLKAIQEYKTDKHAILMFKMVGAYFQSVGSFAMASDPPVGIAMWCVGFAMEKVIPYFIEHKEYFEKAKLFIDTNFPTLSILWDICKHGNKDKDDNDSVKGLDSRYTYKRGAGLGSVNPVILHLYSGQSLHLKCFKINTMLLDYDIDISGGGYCTQVVYDVRDGTLIHSSTGKEKLWTGGILWNSTIPEMDLSVNYGSVDVIFNTAYGLIGYYITGCPAFSQNTEPTEENNVKSEKYTHNGHDYQYINYAKSYDDAKQWCESNGGHLVTVSSEDENNFIKQLMNENNSTLIATNSQIENDGQSQYISISDDGTWTREPSYESPVSFICEWDYTSSLYQIGDTNLDGKITISDVTEIQRHLAELIRFTDEQLVLADTNGDGKVDINDATHLQKYLAEFDGIVLGKQSA